MLEAVQSPNVDLNHSLMQITIMSKVHGCVVGVVVGYVVGGVVPDGTVCIWGGVVVVGIERFVIGRGAGIVVVVVTARAASSSSILRLFSSTTAIPPSNLASNRSTTFALSRVLAASFSIKRLALALI